MSEAPPRPSGPEVRALTGPFPFDDDPASIKNRGVVQSSLRDAPELYSSDGESGIRIVRLTQDLVCKYGARVRATEAKNILAVQTELPDFPLPKLVDFWQGEILTETGDVCAVTFLVMHYIDGTPVAELVERMTEHDRESCRLQLQCAVRQLQSLRGNLPGPVGGGVSSGTLFYEYDVGPFDSKNALSAWLNERLIVSQLFRRAPADIQPFDADVQDLVMCHNDLHPFNLILDKANKLWFVDWANSGYYPPAFELASIRDRLDTQWYTSALLQTMSDDDISMCGKLKSIKYGLTTGALITL